MQLGIKKYEIFFDQRLNRWNAIVHMHNQTRASTLVAMIENYNKQSTNDYSRVILRNMSEADALVMSFSRKDGESHVTSGFSKMIRQAKERGDSTYVLWPKTEEELKQVRLQRALLVDTGSAAEKSKTSNDGGSAAVGEGGMGGSASKGGSKRVCESGNTTEDEEECVAPSKGGKRVKLVAKVLPGATCGSPVTPAAKVSAAEALVGMAASSEDPVALKIRTLELEKCQLEKDVAEADDAAVALDARQGELEEEVRQAMQEMDRLVNEKGVLVREKGALVREKGALVREKEALVKEKEALVIGEGELVKEKEALVRGEGELVKANEELVKANEELVKEKAEWTKDTTGWVQRSAEWVKESTDWVETKAALEYEIGELKREKARLVSEQGGADANEGSAGCKGLLRELIATQAVHIADLNSRHRDFIAVFSTVGCSSGTASDQME